MRVLITGGSGFIGTHVIENIIGQYPRAQVLNIDLQQPKLTSHLTFWHRCDLLDLPAFARIVKDYHPTHAIHLAARTDDSGCELSDYLVNIEGSANFINAITAAGGVERTIYYSTQYVVKPGPLAVNEFDYRPVNTYGESKSIMEMMIRRSKDHPGIWTIVRPTNIWGPWHPRYADEFWLVVKKGQYFHPGGDAVIRAYGYVGNVADYTLRILSAPVEQVSRKSFYVGDPPADIKHWVSAFTVALTGREPRIVPRPVLRFIALIGDIIRLTGHPFPLFTSRYKSMTQNYIVDMSPTYAALGNPKYTLEHGVKETVAWLESQGGIWSVSPPPKT